jgi:hypothetical protein
MKNEISTDSPNWILQATAFAATLAAASLLPIVVSAQNVNGIVTDARVFNDFSTTSLSINNGNSVNQGASSQVTVNETGWAEDGIGTSFANRHDFELSTKGGASAHFFNIDNSFTVQAVINLADGSDAPRKEAGFRLNSGATGDSFFLVNSDAGEIVAFGGGAPFELFGNNASGNGYHTGDSILIGFTIRGGGDGIGGTPDTIEYFIDRGQGRETIGPLLWDNVEAGPVNYTVALYTQASPDLSNANEFVSTRFSDIQYRLVPEPSTIASFCGGLFVIAISRWRRRPRFT